MNSPIIYSLSIGDTPIYIGKCANAYKRLNGHKYDCYNGITEKKLYYTIRQIGITKEQFYEYVKINVLYDNVPIEYQNCMEDWVICLYRDNGYNIQNERRGIDCTICIHEKERAQCKECGGSSICEHNRIRNYCKDCGGSAICEHSRIRYQCKICGGYAICIHNKRKSKCKDCGGSEICSHNKQRGQCKECFPVTCSICNKIYSNNTINRHTKTH